MTPIILYIAPVLGVLALGYTFWRSGWVIRQEAGNETMREIAGHIAAGARAFLFAEYRVLAIFALIAMVGLYFLGSASEHSHPLIVVSFLIGALFSVAAGWIGMNIATKANVRT
ncbi:MAG TPA: sodium/proton-translocating pyrophosphatase, partial [Longimicrobium sp.]|nr:sodium/proton-translocating pyrophosphatase [Longimicrobium sp.]